MENAVLDAMGVDGGKNLPAQLQVGLGLTGAFLLVSILCNLFLQVDDDFLDANHNVFNNKLKIAKPLYSHIT